MPCPKSHFPVYAVTVPSAETAIQESSFRGSMWEGCVSNGRCRKANGLASEAALKLTTSAPELFRKSRRETRKSRRETLMLFSRRHISESPAVCAGERSNGTGRLPGLHQFPGQMLPVFHPAQLWRSK